MSPFGGGLVVTERRWHAHVRDIPRLVARAMREAGCGADVVLTDDRTIKQLNARDRGKNKPTNVLTYSSRRKFCWGWAWCGARRRRRASRWRRIWCIC